MNQKRMASVEQGAFLNLRAAVNMARVQEPNLSRRIEAIPGAKRYLHSGLGMLNRLVDELNASIPPEQKEHFERQQESLKMIVGIPAKMPRNTDAEYGRWLSYNQLNVVASAIRECCRICSISDPQQQKQCMFCKLLEVLPTTKPDEDAPGCGYFTLWGNY